MVQAGGVTVANKLRGALLRDANPDTGCALNFLNARCFALPYFDHMHRFCRRWLSANAARWRWCR